MLLDELQKTWQAQTRGPTPRVDAEVLLAQVRKSQQSLKRTIFWRDFREVIVALAMIPFFANAAREQGWPWLSFCAACAWIAGFMLIDRWRQRGKRPTAEAPMSQCADEAIHEVEHQIWLLKNVAAWYLLPIILAAVFTFGYIAVTGSGPLLARVLTLIGGLGIFAVVYAGIYWLNQHAVRASLEPRRQELIAVRESLLTLND